MPVHKRCRPPHPLEHHASYRAVIAAAPALAMLSATLASANVSADLVGSLLIACGDLGQGFGAPPGSRARVRAHHRAWVAVREIDRVIYEARRRRLATPDVIGKAQRAVDRADVMIAALPGVLPS